MISLLLFGYRNRKDVHSFLELSFSRAQYSFSPRSFREGISNIVFFSCPRTKDCYLKHVSNWRERIQRNSLNDVLYSMINALVNSPNYFLKWWQTFLEKPANEPWGVRYSTWSCASCPCGNDPNYGSSSALPREHLLWKKSTVIYWKNIRDSTPLVNLVFLDKSTQRTIGNVLRGYFRSLNLSGAYAFQIDRRSVPDLLFCLTYWSEIQRCASVSIGIIHMCTRSM